MNLVSPRDALLDHMRGFAALAVVCFHYFHKGPKEGWMHTERVPILGDIAAYGYLGVHLFFMISGYVIMMTAQHSNLRRFAASRVSRLVPAFWCCMFLTALVEWGIPQAPFHLISPAQWFANLTLVPSWFGQSGIDGAYWSLAIEITFYLWVALAVALGQVPRVESLMVLWLCVSLVNFVRPMHPLQVYAIVQWAPLFSAGALFFLVRQSGWNRRRCLAIGLACALACGYAWREFGVVSDWRRLISFSGGPNHLLVTVLMVSFFLVFARLASRQDVNEPTEVSDWMGRLTYPLYLIHQNVGYALFNGALAVGLLGPWGHVGFTVFLIALAVAIAWAVHVTVERRFTPALRQFIEGVKAHGGRHQVMAGPHRRSLPEDQ